MFWAESMARTVRSSSEQPRSTDAMRTWVGVGAQMMLGGWMDDCDDCDGYCDDDSG